MAYKSIIAGAALIVVGVFGNIVSDTGSITTLIPAFIGVIFVALGALALLALISSAGSAIGRSSTGLALFTQLATVIVMGAFLVLAIQSFRAARIAREAEAASA